MPLDQKAQVSAALEAVRAVADAIRELKRVPSGVLYSAVMSKLSLESYEKIIGTLKGAGLVREEMHELIWVEPTCEHVSLDAFRSSMANFPTKNYWCKDCRRWLCGNDLKGGAK